MGDLYYYRDYLDDMEEEDELDLFHSLVKFIAIGSSICFIVATIMFGIL